VPKGFNATERTARKVEARSIVFAAIPSTPSCGRNASERVAEPVVDGGMPVVLFSLAHWPQ
jgi:hypothetical protein